jgi:hypothetical protein|tara:strand:+ start:145 stop:330 length:186 start_codon:yes stop_codon:yes gene_type:complete
MRDIIKQAETFDGVCTDASRAKKDIDEGYKKWAAKRGIQVGWRKKGNEKGLTFKCNNNNAG